jgi:hypothetical protein
MKAPLSALGTARSLARPKLSELPHMRILLLRPLIAIACALVLLGVLSLYFQPDFLLTLANQVWGCF